MPENAVPTHAYTQPNASIPQYTPKYINYEVITRRKEIISLSFEGPQSSHHGMRQANVKRGERIRCEYSMTAPSLAIVKYRVYWCRHRLSDGT
jgi:hypothetical protein